eukprot:CAMPEP_0198704348 /NCGR_PEP_ID=MMETSP1468-20131203/389857_1 /TAXON_ID=1461545 /ORGANISM="Mantoniella sp, Strain CCMP1436" /LENGTH=392 /DNA_ID=CAMNT_0044463159 /DNA_START=205 /DNA_END=1384 /DNA_ORIENTATION=-
MRNHNTASVLRPEKRSCERDAWCLDASGPCGCSEVRRRRATSAARGVTDVGGRTVVTRAHCLGGVMAGKTSPATTREERGMGRGSSGGGSLTMLGCTSTHLERTAYSQCRCRREPWVGERQPSPPPLRAGRLATALLARVPRLQLCRGGGGNDHVKLNHRISASTNLRKAFGEVRESHLGFGPRDAATACHWLAKHVGRGQTIESDQDEATFQLAIQAAKRTARGQGETIESDQDEATFQLAIQAAKRTASEMESHAVEHTVGRSKAGSERDGGGCDGVRAVSEQAPRVADGMKPQAVSRTLLAIAKLAGKGMDVDVAGVQAMSEQARRRMADGMEPRVVSGTLWAIAKLRRLKGMEVNAAVMRAVNKQARHVAGEMGASRHLKNLVGGQEV